jgi:hypothetical protein
MVITAGPQEVLQVCFTTGTSRLTGCCANCSVDVRPNTFVKPTRMSPAIQTSEIIIKGGCGILYVFMVIFSFSKHKPDGLIQGVTYINEFTLNLL